MGFKGSHVLVKKIKKRVDFTGHVKVTEGLQIKQMHIHCLSKSSVTVGELVYREKLVGVLGRRV